MSIDPLILLFTGITSALAAGAGYMAGTNRTNAVGSLILASMGLLAAFVIPFALVLDTFQWSGSLKLAITAWIILAADPYDFVMRVFTKKLRPKGYSLIYNWIIHPVCFIVVGTLLGFWMDIIFWQFTPAVMLGLVGAWVVMVKKEDGMMPDDRVGSFEAIRRGIMMIFITLLLYAEMLRLAQQTLP